MNIKTLSLFILVAGVAFAQSESSGNRRRFEALEKAAPSVEAPAAASAGVVPDSKSDVHLPVRGSEVSPSVQTTQDPASASVSKQASAADAIESFVKGEKPADKPAVNASGAQGEPRFSALGESMLVGPSFIEGWAVVPLQGYAARDMTEIPLADGKVYRVRVPGYLLVPLQKEGLVTINPQVLPTVNFMIAEQRRLVSELQKRLSEVRPLPIQNY